MLRKRNSRGLIAFEDITDPTFQPTRYGVTMPELIGGMHGVRSDGSIATGIDVFAEVYEAIGWTWIARLLRFRLTRPFALKAYRLFAMVRPTFSRFKHDECTGGKCRTPIG